MLASIEMKGDGSFVFCDQVEPWTLLACFPDTEPCVLPHSCDPTTFVIADSQGVSFVFAARMCAPGELVSQAAKHNLVSYPVGLRSKALGVECSCARCIRERKTQHCEQCEVRQWALFLMGNPARAEAHALLLLVKPKLEAKLEAGLLRTSKAPLSDLKLLRAQVDALSRLWSLRGKSPAAEVDQLLVCETLTAILTLRGYVCSYATRAYATRASSGSVPEKIKALVVKGVAWTLRLVHELRSRNKVVPPAIALQVYAVCLCGLALGVEHEYNKPDDKPTRRALWAWVNGNSDCLSVLTTAGLGEVTELCLTAARSAGLDDFRIN
jgi:hypothetical protein